MVFNHYVMHGYSIVYILRGSLTIITLAMLFKHYYFYMVVAPFIFLHSILIISAIF